MKQKQDLPLDLEQKYLIKFATGEQIIVTQREFYLNMGDSLKDRVSEVIKDDALVRIIEVIPIKPESPLQEQSESYKKKYNDCLEELAQLGKEKIELIEQQLRLSKENKTLREMFSHPSIPLEVLSYLQDMIADDAFNKMVAHYKILDSFTTSFFLLFQNFGDGSSLDEYKRIIDNSYNFSQTVLKVRDEFSDSFYPIIELVDIQLTDQNKKEE